MGDQFIESQEEDQPTEGRQIHVFVHVPSKEHTFLNYGRYFAQVPKVGEYLALSSSGSWYEVDMVVHCGFEATYRAEVYAHRVDHSKVRPRSADLLAKEPLPRE